MTIRKRDISAALCVLGAALSVAACGGDGKSSNGTEAVDPAAAATTLPQGSERVDLDAADFSIEIDNPYWPMQPGNRWVYRETDTRGTAEKVVVEVTAKTKMIDNGVEARVIRDTVSEKGVPVEITDDWYAQDSQGNIWYLGEYVTNYEDGKVVDHAGSFEAGVDGAQAGIIMPADPQDGMQYRQEYYEGEAEDNGEVLSVDEQAEVPFGKFEDVLLTKDTITIEPNVLEYKLYAPDVGPVLVFGVSGGGGSEQLIDLEDVGPKAAKAAGTAPLGSPYP